MAIDMKEEIVSAAKRLLLNDSTKKLTVKDIVEECNITRQAFYYHFESIPEMFEWTLKKEGRAMLEEAIRKGSFEEGLKYIFRLTLNILPYIRKSLESPYGTEIEIILRDSVNELFDNAAEREERISGRKKEDVKFIMRYHAAAVKGILETWTDEDTKHLDDIVHRISTIIENS